MTDDLSGQVAQVFLDMLSAIDYVPLHRGEPDPGTTSAITLAAARFSELPAFTLLVDREGDTHRVGIDLTPMLAGAVRLLNILVQHVVDTTSLKDEHEVIAALRAHIAATDSAGTGDVSPPRAG